MRPIRHIVFLLGGLSLLTITFSTTVVAHCPLCTAGAGGAAALASALGVGLVIVGVFVGAFAIAMGLWTASYLDRRYVRHQHSLVAIAVFLSIVIPVLPFMGEYTPLYLTYGGEYGSVLNRTYLVNDFLLGSLVGAAITAGTPRMSAFVSRMRGTTVPFQGMILTFGFLSGTAVLLHILL